MDLILATGLVVVALAAVICFPLSMKMFSKSWESFYVEQAKSQREELNRILEHNEATMQVGGQPVAFLNSEREMLTAERIQEAKQSERKLEMTHEFSMEKLRRAEKYGIQAPLQANEDEVARERLRRNAVGD